MNPQIENNFKHHPPKTDAVAAAYQTVRTMCKQLAIYLDVTLPASREKSLAMTKLEETMFWSNASIARNQEVE